MIGEEGAPSGSWVPGRHVAVRNRFNGNWARGFRIDGTVGPRGYRIRRVSDDAVLPVAFPPEDLRLV
jgi:hypothetical protein